MLVSNMVSNKTGHAIPNQHIIEGIHGNYNYELFQSYASPIALKYLGITAIFENWDYSKTTGKYRNQFLNDTKAETQKKIDSGEYLYAGSKHVEWALDKIDRLIDQSMNEA